MTHALVVEEGFGERYGVRLEIRELFADPDEFNRNVQFIDDATTMPPLAVPSSLVMTSPVSPSVS